MKGSNRVVEQLLNLLRHELAARDQYFIHSRIYKDMGLKTLYERLNHEMEEETAHADVLLERILFLEANPDLSNPVPLNIGSTVPEMLANDLDYEVAVASSLKEAMAICESEQDYVSRNLLHGLLYDTEMDHTYWLRQQLGLIEKIGLPNYLQKMTG